MLMEQVPKCAFVCTCITIGNYILSSTNLRTQLKMAEKNNDQILQTRSIPAKPVSHPQEKTSRKYTDEDATKMGRSDIDQTVAAETQFGENAGITTAKEEHHHHHHHHHHETDLFHSSINNVSDFFNFVLRLFKTPYTLAYIIVFVMFLCSMLIASPKCVLFVRAFRGAMEPEQFYRFQEYVFIHQSHIMAIPMRIALVAVIIILFFVRIAHPGKFNAYFLRISPALLVAAFFSLPIFHLGGVTEDRFSCRNNLKEYYSVLKQYAFEHDGVLPNSLDELNIPRSSILSFCAKDHYEFPAAGKALNTQTPEVLLTDSQGQHAGNYRLMLMSDGSFLESLYGGEFKAVKTSDNQDQANDKAPSQKTKPVKSGKYE